MKHKHPLPPWLRPSTQTPAKKGVRVDVGWYSPSEWSRVKASADDPERFEDSYAEWLQMAEETLATLQAPGVLVEKAWVGADDLLAWCLVHGKPNDAAARAQFAAERKRPSDTAD